MSITVKEQSLKSSRFPNSDITLEQAIDSYKQSLEKANTEGATPSLELDLEILYARDRIEYFLTSDETDITAKALIQVSELDGQLKKLRKAIASHQQLDTQLENCRDSIKPPETSWWWFFTPQVAQPAKPSGWAAQDWLWNRAISF